MTPNLQYWLDGQVLAGQLTPAQAREFLPAYQPPPGGITSCLQHVDEDDDTHGSGPSAAAGR